MSDTDRLIAYLSDGRVHSRLQIQTELCLCGVTQRITDARKKLEAQGQTIEKARDEYVNGKRRTAYRIVTRQGVLL